MPPTNLIFDDGEPLESNRHRIAMNTLIRSLQQAWSDRNDFFTGGNMFIYYSSAQVRNRDFRGPDFFAVLDVEGTTERQGWVVWEEGGRYPNVIVELMSSSTAAIDTGAKKEIYDRIFRTPDYFVFNPFDANSLQGWHLDSSLGYQPLVPNEQGWLWCQTLGFWLGTWEGTIDRETAVWLRFYDEAGNLVLLPEEAAQQQLEIAQQQAQAAQQQLEAAQQQGLQQGALRQLLRILTTRFGEVPPEVEQGLQALDLNQLEDLVEVALAVETLAQFTSQLSEG
jgi:Uma2 family endonuclease